MRVGVISDTHGLLRPEAIASLASSDLILHAGDIGKPAVLEELAAIAPVIAVRGNNDQGEWANLISTNEKIQIESVAVYMLHIVKDLSLDPIQAGIRVIISGHSHKPEIKEQAGVLFLNPGSAGPRRFKLPISVAQLDINGTDINAQIIELPL